MISLRTIKNNNNIKFNKIISENSYFKQLTKIDDPVYPLYLCREKQFFKSYKKYKYNSIRLPLKENKYNNKKLKVLGIFDEMFYESVKFLFDITLCRNDIKYNIPKDIDLFIVESCWRGNNMEFRNVITSNKPILKILVNKCKKLNIPTIFINKEDYIHYDTFINAAKLFDYIFTCDINCINKYKKDCPNAKGIYSNPFFINVHSITKSAQHKEYGNDVLFAGSWYTRPHGSRSADMIELFDECLKNKLKLHIIDRNSERNVMDIFPNKYADNLYHSVDYKDLLHNVHNQFEYVLNLNSVILKQCLLVV